jgi:hypothetical protein
MRRAQRHAGLGGAWRGVRGVAHQKQHYGAIVWGRSWFVRDATFGFCKHVHPG